VRTAKIPSNYADKWKAQHGGYERFAYKKFNAALKEQIRPVIDHVKHYGGVSATLADMLIKKQPIEDAYRTVYLKIGVLHAASTMRSVNSLGRSLKSGTGFFSEQWNRLMSLFYTTHSAQRISDVTETTRERVRKVLDDSQDLPISQQATYITDTLGAGDFNRNRALMIARTETTTAANYGASLGNESADYETAKQWLAIEDANTRPDHTDADGQVVPNTDFFTVGGYSMYYPGDISAPAKEVCNCRCTAVYVPLLDSLGLPILKNL